MNISNLIDQGLNLMMLGMGMVFFILGLLVIIIKVVSNILMRYEPTVTGPQVKTQGPAKIDDDVVTAISIAIQRFRSK
ncbi:hypothetical protein A9Q82_06465 [Cycloclasticus sp. 46_120_T64]|nr:hypothetical protein A9Q82_06465 [Cycloclasticus sp. 46_120_T64]